jgi:hypothetical protein
MNSTRLGWLLVVVGLIVVALAALADPIGIGGGGAFGAKQAIGVVVGGLAAVVGIVLLRRPTQHRDDERSAPMTP